MTAAFEGPQPAIVAETCHNARLYYVAAGPESSWQVSAWCRERLFFVGSTQGGEPQAVMRGEIPPKWRHVRVWARPLLDGIVVVLGERGDRYREVWIRERAA